MSILSSVTSILGLIKIPGIGVPREECKHDGGWKDAKNDDCQPHKDYCQPQKDYCDPKPSDDCGKGDIYRNAGEALAKFDFSRG